MSIRHIIILRRFTTCFLDFSIHHISLLLVIILFTNTYALAKAAIDRAMDPFVHPREAKGLIILFLSFPAIPYSLKVEWDLIDWKEYVIVPLLAGATRLLVLPQKVVHLIVCKIEPIQLLKGGFIWPRKDTNRKKSSSNSDRLRYYRVRGWQQQMQSHRGGQVNRFLDLKPTYTFSQNHQVSGRGTGASNIQW